MRNRWLSLLFCLLLLAGAAPSWAQTNTPPTPTPSPTETVRPTRTPTPTFTPRPSNTPTPTLTPTPDTRLPTFPIPVSSFGYGARLSPDNRTVALFNLAGFYSDTPDPTLTTISLMDTLLGEITLTLPGSTDFVTDAVFTQDGARLVTYHHNGDLLIWDVETGALLREVQTYFLNRSLLHLLNDGVRVFVFSRTSSFSMIINLETGAVEEFIGRRFENRREYNNLATNFAGVFEAETQLSAFAVTPDERTIVFANNNGDLLRFNRDTRDLTVWREPPNKLTYERQSAIQNIQFTPDGSLLVVADIFAGELRWLDPQTGDVLGRQPGLDTPAFGIAPDSRSVVWFQRNARAAYLSRLEPNSPVRLIATFDGTHQITPNTSVKFSSDGETLLIGGVGAQNTGSSALYVIDTRELGF